MTRLRTSRNLSKTTNQRLLRRLSMELLNFRSNKGFDIKILLDGVLRSLGKREISSNHNLIPRVLEELRGPSSRGPR